MRSAYRSDRNQYLDSEEKKTLRNNPSLLNFGAKLFSTWLQDNVLKAEVPMVNKRNPLF
jgi:hypothetical protein